MKKFFSPISKLIFYDIRKLLFLEIFIKLLGLLIIYPLFRLGFYVALKISGFKYVSNTDLISFILKPTTLLIGLFILLIFSIYLTLEYVFLVILYDNAYHEVSMSYKAFIIIGLTKFMKVLKRYNMFILIPTLLFFIVIEYTQIALFSSTLKISSDLLAEIRMLKYFDLVFYLSFVLLTIFFINFIFLTHSFILEGNSIKTSFKKNIKKNRLDLLGRFILYNLFINILMLLVYGLVILIISLFVLLYRGEDVVFGLIITSMYTSYWIIGFIFSSILIPLNIAIASHKYYEQHHIESKSILKINRHLIQKNGLRWFIKPLILTFIIIFVLNIFTITGDIRLANDQFQFFKQEEIIAHRGASLEAPENTLASIELAIQLGVDAVEIDIQGTKDHIPIILHDKTLTRTTNATTSVPVSNLEYAYIETLDAGSWFSNEFIGQKVPKLEDVFENFQNNTIYFLDVKTNDTQIEDEILRLIELYDLTYYVKVMSFEPTQLKRFKDANPELETILLIATFYGNLNALIKDDSINHFALRSTIIENHANIITTIHAQGKKAYAWSADNEATINTAVRADVDGFITKNPIESREIAHSKNSNLTFKELLENLFE